MSGTSPIDDYVTVLGRRLRGPGRVKRDLLAEARDSLVDCAEAYRSEGMDRPAAERLAVEEFGPVEEIAPGYQEELASSAGRRLAALVFVSVPVTALLWSLIWQVFPMPSHAWERVPSWVPVLSDVIDWSQLVMGALGGVALVCLGRGLRRIRRSRAVVRAFGVIVGANVVLVGVMSAALSLGGGELLGGFYDYPPGLALSWLSLLVSLWQLCCAAGCLVTTRPVLPAGTRWPRTGGHRPERSRS